MPGEEKDKSQPSESRTKQSASPLVFISHDSRDAELAEAFSKLLSSVSAGMLKSFRSSDKKGSEGIEFGDEWYKRLMAKLDSASDVVCLLTERSVGRPWILYEAGVAKGKLDIAVIGVALGVPLGAISAGPFYQFQNLDDSEDSLAKLVKQLAKRIPGCEPYDDVVKSQVQMFKATVEKILPTLKGARKGPESESPPDSAAKIFEEMKVMIRDLPPLIEDRLSRVGPSLRRRLRKFHPGMLHEFMGAERGLDNPIIILIIGSFVRDQLPWLYEIAVDAYRALTTGNRKATEQCLRALHAAMDLTMRGPFMEELVSSKEEHMLMMEIPQMLDHAIGILLEERRPTNQPNK